MSKPHTCYFHKNKPITSFCTLAQCTLPMCQECLPIHSQEHHSEEDEKGIIPFQRAEQQAISTLKMKLNVLTKNKNQCQQALTNTKNQLLEIVNSFIKQQQSTLNHMFESLEDTQKKLQKIQKGSLKSLIYFYSADDKQIQQFERTSLTYRSSLQQKIKQIKQSFSNSFTTSLYEPQRKEEPEIPTMRQINGKNSINQRLNENAYNRQRHRQDELDSRRDRGSLRQEGFSKQHKSYQHRQIFTQKSSDNLQIYSKKKNYNDEKTRKTEKFEPEYTRNRIHTEVDHKPTFKSSYQFEQTRKQYKQYEPNYIREEKKKVDFYDNEQMHRYNSKADLGRKEEEWSKKPLLPSDLNLEYTNSVRLSSEKGRDFKSKVELSKQVLSPEEIRKMLEKRIEERSRIISKTKNMTPPRYEQTLQDNDRNWETKDSIINQIYSDYRY